MASGRNVLLGASCSLMQDREIIEKSLKPWGEGELLRQLCGICGICGVLWDLWEYDWSLWDLSLSVGFVGCAVIMYVKIGGYLWEYLWGQWSRWLSVGSMVSGLQDHLWQMLGTLLSTLQRQLTVNLLWGKT